MMRLNISVPDDLAAEVRRRKIPISATCQRALCEAIRDDRSDGPKCARCLAALCGHQICRSGEFRVEAAAIVAGTSCCTDCAPVLLELVLHPLRLVPG